MESIRSLFVPGLFFALWFACAAATITQLAEMGGALETAEAAQRDRQAEVARAQIAKTAIHEGHADLSSRARPRRFQ